MMRQPTLKQIEAFKALVESGTVSKAAEMLNVSQPAVSKLLTHLEQDAGFSLLKRGRGRIQVTERGMRLYDEIDRVFSGVNQIRQAIAAIRKEDGGHLQIGGMPGIPSRYLASSASRFREIYPDIQLSFTFRSSDFISNALLSRRFDLGIVTTSVEHPNFVTRILDSRPLVAVLPKDHYLAKRKTVSIKDLDGLEFVSFAENSPTRQAVLGAMKEHDANPRIVIQATTAQTVCECVAAGMGVAVMSPIFVPEPLLNIELRPLKENLKVPILTVRLAEGPMAVYVDRFIEIFAEESKSSSA